MSVLPPGWIEVSLDAVAETRLGKMLSKKSKTGVGSRSYLRNKNVQWGQFDLDDVAEMDFTGKEFERFRLEPGDLLVCEGGEVGRAAIWRGAIRDCAYQKALHRVRTAAGVLPEYLLYLLMHYQMSDVLQRFVTGSTIAHLPQEDLRTIPVPLPPAPEQRRIVGAIEEQFSRADAGIESLRQAKRRLERHCASVLIAAVEGRLVQAEDDAQWSVVAIEDVSEVVSGQTPKGLTDVPGGRIPYFKVGDMNVGDGRHMTVARTYLDEAAADRNRLRLHPAGTTVFPKRGGAIATNKKRMLVQPSAFDLNTMGVVPGPTVDGDFLWLWFQTVDLRGLSDGSNVPQINHGDIKPLRLALPPLQEQRRIGREVDRQLSILEATSRAVENGLARAEALRQVILRDAFSGRLTAQDPTDEPVSTLLDRIREPRLGK